MFIERILSLFGGKLRRWVKTRESHDPEAVYESAIADRVRRYQQLKSAAAGVIYMRSKLERDLKAQDHRAGRGRGTGGAGGRHERGSMRAHPAAPQA